MDRLRVLTLVAAAATLLPSAGLQLLPHCQAAPMPLQTATAEFAVAGDVVACNTYRLPQDRPITVRDALLAAGCPTQSASVAVIPAGHARVQSTQTVNLQAADSGERVSPGDLLIVQALSGLTQSVRSNAVLRTPAGLRVVELADEQVAIGDVLMQTGSMPAPGTEIRVLHRLQGRLPVEQARLEDPVLHGDVIDVVSPDSRSSAGFGGMVPAISEWPSSVPAEAVSEQGPATGSTESGSDNTVTPLLDFLPSQLEQSGPGPVESAPAADTAESSDRAGDDSSVTEVPDPFLPERPTGSRDLSVQAVAQSQTGTGSLVDTEADAPLPPLEQVLPAAPPTAELNLWNIVFIGGLLVAGTLILAGSLRVDDEPSAASHPSASGIAVPAAEVVTTPVQAPAQLTVPASVELQPASRAVPAARVSVPVTLSGTVTRSPESVRHPDSLRNLVVSTEWFSGEWINSPVPVPAATAAAVELPLQPDTDRIPVPAAAVQNPVPHVPVSTKAVQQNIVTDRTGQSTLDQAASGNANTTLEDLLRNRLPVELRRAALPVRITLFGRPAGPRHLRIDPAHTQLAGPHTALAERRRLNREGTESGESLTDGSLSEARDGAHYTLHNRIDS